jgi:putative transposase
VDRRFQTQRQSHRLKDFDYSSPGAYFITINAQTRGVNWFGMVTRDEIELNDAGLMIQRELKNLTTRFSSLELDTYIIMPDHIHVILVLQNNANDESMQSNRRGDLHGRPATQRQHTFAIAANAGIENQSNPTRKNRDPHDVINHASDRATTRVAPTNGVVLCDVVGGFKSLTTNQYIKGVRESGWSPFEKRFWQRDYFERVLRDDVELETRRKYIVENPLRWQLKNPQPP